MTTIHHVDGAVLVTAKCPACHTPHAFPIGLYDAAKASADISVHCPYGHSWHYKSQKELNDEEKLRLERDRLKQRLAEKDDEIAAQKQRAAEAERREAAQKGQVTRLKNRAKAGLCPCCNRHFTNLERHMASQHKEETAA